MTLETDVVDEFLIIYTRQYVISYHANYFISIHDALHYH